MRNARIVGPVVAVVLLGVAAAAWALGAANGGDVAGAVGPTVDARVEADGAELERLPAGARLLVRAADEVAPRADGRLYELSRERGAVAAGELRCKQVHASAAGPGLCLRLAADGQSYEAVVFDAGYAPRRRFAVPGVPDRARVSRDGRYAGFTSFDWGSSQGYLANTSDFSVDTRIVDLGSGRTVQRLDDDLEIVRDGKRFAPADRELWGVTFADGGRWYATMGDVFDHFLIAGRVGSRRARVVAKRVECPSLSPDGRRIAYKRRIPYTDTWRFHVLDLRTGADVALAERRSIDDQPEWLGDDRVVYSDDRAVFAVPADGSGEPERIADGAASQAFLDD